MHLSIIFSAFCGALLFTISIFMIYIKIHNYVNKNNDF